MKQHARLASSVPKAALSKVTASSAFDAGTEVKPKADEVSARDRGETSGGGGEDPTGRLNGGGGEDPTGRSSGAEEAERDFLSGENRVGRERKSQFNWERKEIFYFSLLTLTVRGTVRGLNLGG